MINPATLSEAIADRLRSIPELVAELGGDASRIQSYETDFPRSITSIELIRSLPSLSVTVVWDGTDPTTASRMAVWSHRFLVIIKSQENNYADIVTIIANGTPTDSSADGLRFIRTPIHPNCDPIGPFSSQRKQLFIDDRASMDFFELSFSLAERGREA